MLLSSISISLQWQIDKCKTNCVLYKCRHSKNGLCSRQWVTQHWDLPTSHMMLSATVSPLSSSVTCTSSGSEGAAIRKAGRIIPICVHVSHVCMCAMFNFCRWLNSQNLDFQWIITIRISYCLRVRIGVGWVNSQSVWVQAAAINYYNGMKCKYLEQENLLQTKRHQIWVKSLLGHWGVRKCHPWPNQQWKDLIWNTVTLLYFNQSLLRNTRVYP